jgi:hypothetical protein
MLRSNIAATARAGNRRKGPLSALRAYTNHRRQKSYDGERYGRLSAPPGGPGQVASPFLTARAGNRRFWCLSAMRAHTKAPYKTDLHRKTLRELKRPGGPGQQQQNRTLAVLVCAAGDGKLRGLACTTSLARGESVIKCLYPSEGAR